MSWSRASSAQADASRLFPQARGTTLLELLATMLIFAVVVIGIFLLWERSQHAALRGSETAGAQQQARAALESIVREIRQATSIVTGENGRLIFRSVNDDQQRGFDLQAAATCQLNCVRFTLGNETQAIADHITALQFAYLDGNGNPLATPLSAAALGSVQQVNITLRGQMVFADPDPPFTFNASVRLRNR